MTVVYNAFPIESHLAMVNAQLASVAVLQDQAKMWTDVRAWIESARTELNTRIGNLATEWTDEAGRELETKTRRTLAELSGWGERIDSSQVVSNLTTLAGAIPEAASTVSGLYQAYVAALSNPFTAPAAFAIQQASGARMTALGAQLDASMLTVCAASGVASPAELVPGIQLPSASEATKAAKAATEALSAVEGLVSSLTGGSGTGVGSLPGGTLPDWSAPDWSSGGPALAGIGGGVDPAGFGGGMSSTGVPVGGIGPTGAAQAPPVASGALSGAAGTGGAGGVLSPMMPMSGGRGSGGVPRAGAAERPAGRTGTRRKPANGSDGVLAGLRGRAGASDPAQFALPRDRSGEVLDSEIWDVH
ncbi:hypothetical protein Lfu02_02490 [Longispora fulva]|uniref:PPE family protein n=1 Tax=Longispora fulva TaxID=619741 RepID=A0A8J7GC69_9ACTN|nr:hypothetical protein [Longispora fulva]MBG6135879.1 hypothetical protein [Longispora fulva]GIG55877.1 hypothetical protein Lfu02_02490 [Longispora fulva]